MMTVIDATDLILGRMATVVAKRLLQGEQITILNAEKAVVSGKRSSRVKELKKRLEIGHPRKGPYLPRQPDRFVKRSIRGMLPRKKPKGIEAYRRLRVFIGVPRELEGETMEQLPEAHVEKLKSPYITVGELVQEIGWSRPGD
ncbi:50S ribosomal protein L13 [Candidatus Bathyarchaeota archaeon]|nr:50S ribosomal protein L13 [Candidatus Bathyarchaeota archaeon]MCK5631151.1 50S ribosomal protein L13 [Candidatus Bathyarchaeota archaeon]